jgi:hypothetical protein
MGHNTAICAILRWVRVRVGCINIKHDSVGARVTATEDTVPMQDGELIQRFTLACVREFQPAVIAEGVRVTT